MRIITGKLKGRVIPIPKTDELRPTSDRTKEGIFSVINARTYLDNTTVLDLFAGSGNLGFEAISRGAEKCLFIDNVPEHIAHIEKIAEKFGIKTQVQTRVLPVENFLEKQHNRYDFIFADPPYDYYKMAEMIDIIMDEGWLKEDGWFILEHDKRHDFTNHPKCVYSKPYGRTIVSIFKESNVDF
ncbi:MAG: 16S rRNA (guanine(966)-N(2))-methyltransferase RsmD [Balneolaceae bacterium]|nr:MAG: 16S rRNA (guanine(966)-N(2))-methyltransferase RsmD [Balneolaceae bacterium]